MNSSVISNIVNEYESLSYDDKLYVIDIFQKQLIDVKRAEIRIRADEATVNLETNLVSRGSVSDLFMDMDND